MKKLITFLALAFCLNGNAQTWQWAKGATGVGSEEGYSSATDTAGNVFITGSFTGSTISFGAYTLTNAGTNANVFITKYAPNGNVLWAKSATGTVSDYGFSVSTDVVGNVFVTGCFQSPSTTFGTYTLTNAGTNSNIFIAKYDANGNVLWAKSAGGIADDRGYGVTTDATGNVLVTGYFQSPTITFGTYTLTNSGNYDVFIAKYDANGNIL